MKREAILRTSARMFRQRGFEYVSLSEIAETLNITKPTLYYYFDSKDHLLVEIMRRAQEALIDGLAAASDLNATGVDKLRLALLNYSREIASDYGRVLSLINIGALEPKSRAEVDERIVRADRAIYAILEDGYKDGSIRPMNSKVAYHTIFGSLNWLARWYREDGPLSLEQVTEMQVDILLQGMAGVSRP